MLLVALGGRALAASLELHHKETLTLAPGTLEIDQLILPDMGYATLSGPDTTLRFLPGASWLLGAKLGRDMQYLNLTDLGHLEFNDVLHEVHVGGQRQIANVRIGQDDGQSAQPGGSLVLGPDTRITRPPLAWPISKVRWRITLALSR